ncbi:2-oxoacid ferredoxin oxidoreductase [Candidatus Nomurabacteria bacterium]|nr:2-oxoacid ferredoxin oxidoreductase [Candidatus Nomurabacteria bacterium]MCB9803370.1 2-oxoacid ferredoxin oxidoreductase [Candidatus Nomurabacteria bacterium]
MSDCSLLHTGYNSDNLYTWCTNCGNYGIHGSLKTALAEQDLLPHEVVLCFDIGCHGNGADKIHANTVHGLHGRVIPFAVGIQLANRKLKVVASGGDGATLGEGINHFIHAIRSDYDITFLLHNNSNYGLTTGQASPTTTEGVPMNSSPDGVSATPIHVLDLVFSLKPTFVARTFSGDIKQMTRVIKAGMKHKGFSVIEILQHCPTYNKATPHEWYRERVYDVNKIMNYDTSDIGNAQRVSKDITDKIATGVIYQRESMDFYSKQLNRKDRTTELVEEVNSYPVDDLYRRFI